MLIDHCQSGLGLLQTLLQGRADAYRSDRIHQPIDLLTQILGFLSRRPNSFERFFLNVGE
nr:hypothetical protein [uncultured Roseateles sp.]